MNSLLITCWTCWQRRFTSYSICLISLSYFFFKIKETFLMNTEGILKTKQFDHKLWYSFKQSCTVRIQAPNTVSLISVQLFPSFFPLFPFFFSHQLLTQSQFKWYLLQAPQRSWEISLLRLEVMHAAHRMTAACSQVPGVFPHKTTICVLVFWAWFCTTPRPFKELLFSHAAIPTLLKFICVIQAATKAMLLCFFKCLEWQNMLPWFSFTLQKTLLSLSQQSERFSAELLFAHTHTQKSFLKLLLHS